MTFLHGLFWKDKIKQPKRPCEKVPKKLVQTHHTWRRVGYIFTANNGIRIFEWSFLELPYFLKTIDESTYIDDPFQPVTPPTQPNQTGIRASLHALQIILRAQSKTHLRDWRIHSKCLYFISLDICHTTVHNIKLPIT